MGSEMCIRDRGRGVQSSYSRGQGRPSTEGKGAREDGMLTTQPRSSLLAYSQRVCWSTGRPGRERGPVGPDPAVSTGGLCGSLRQPTCAVERSSASGWTRGRVPARLTWPAKPCALPWALSWVLPWVLPWALLWALPWALPRSAVGQQSVSSRSAARRWPAGRRWQIGGARAMDVVAELCCLLARCRL